MLAKINSDTVIFSLWSNSKQNSSEIAVYFKNETSLVCKKKMSLKLVILPVKIRKNKKKCPDIFRQMARSLIGTCK